MPFEQAGRGSNVLNAFDKMDNDDFAGCDPVALDWNLNGKLIHYPSPSQRGPSERGTRLLGGDQVSIDVLRHDHWSGWPMGLRGWSDVHTTSVRDG
jgi:hypothetical protein